MSLGWVQTQSFFCSRARAGAIVCVLIAQVLILSACLQPVKIDGNPSFTNRSSSGGAIPGADAQVDSAQSTFVVNTTPVVADGASTAYANFIFRDSQGQFVAGVLPTLSIAGGPTYTCSVSGADGASACSITSTLVGDFSVQPLTPFTAAAQNATFTHGAAVALRYVTSPVGNTIPAVGFTSAPSVEIIDTWGHRVTTGASSVLTVSLGLGSALDAMGNPVPLSGTLSQVATAGLASFGGLSIPMAGTFTLSATAAGLTAAAASVRMSICDSGTEDSTCNVSTSKTLPAGSKVQGSGSLTVQNGITLSIGTQPKDRAEFLFPSGLVTVGGTIVGTGKIAASSFNLLSGGLLNATGRGQRGGFANGYAVGSGEGAGGGAFSAGVVAASGASFGGTGGDGVEGAATVAAPGAYGAANLTAGILGSGGGSPNNSVFGGNGGGSWVVETTGNATFSGQIQANGENGAANATYASGGGSGGSIYIKVGGALISGIAAELQANGGDGGSMTSAPFATGGGGGGGRIRIEANEFFRGWGRVFAGRGGSVSTDGTLWTETPASSLCDTGSLSTTCAVNNPKLLGGNLFPISISGSLTTSSTSSLRSATNRELLDFVVGGNFTHNGTIQGDVKRIQTTGNIFLQSSSLIQGNIGGEDSATLPGLVSAGTVTLSSGSFINASSRGNGGANGRSLGKFFGRSASNGLGMVGYDSNSGNSAGVGTGSFSGPSSGGGGGYGANGGGGSTANAFGGVSFGSAFGPAFYFGSGAGGAMDPAFAGGNGGGIVRVSATNSITHNGVVSANGGAGEGAGAHAGGGGSGGSVVFSATTLLGSGIVEVKGGDGMNATSDGGGGSGGYASFGGANGSTVTVVLTGGLGNAVGGSGASYGF